MRRQAALALGLGFMAVASPVMAATPRAGQACTRAQLGQAVKVAGGRLVCQRATAKANGWTFVRDQAAPYQLARLGSPPAIRNAQPGTTEVVAGGTLIPDGDDFDEAVVLSSNEAGPVTPEITGTIRDASGRLVGTSSQQVMVPRTVRPGGVAIGMIRHTGPFDPSAVKFSGALDNKNEPYRPQGLPVTELNGLPGDDGTSSRIVGTVKNPSGSRTNSTVVAVLCFGANGRPGEFNWVLLDPIPAGATRPFELRTVGACPNALVGAEGLI